MFTQSVLQEHITEPAANQSAFAFTEGQYRLDVFAHLLGDRKLMLLFRQELTVTRDMADAMKEAGAGVLFHWGPDSGRYLPHVDKRPPLPDPEDFIGLLGLRPGKGSR